MKYKLIGLLALLITNTYGALTYNFNTVGVGTIAPLGPAPWLTLQVDEINSTAVQFTVTSNLNSKEFYSKIGINLNSSYNFNTTRTFSNYTQIGTFNAPEVVSGNNIFNGGGGSQYDLLFAMATSGNDGGIHRFGLKNSFSFRIDGVGISAFETEDSNHPAIAHVQNLEREESSWLISSPVPTQVPEPSSMLLGCVGALALLRRRR